MRMVLIPSGATIGAIAGIALATVVALVLRVPPATVGRFAAGVLLFGLAYVLIDLGRSAVAWRHVPLQWRRRLPAALALGVQRTLACALVNEGLNDWHVELFDHVDPRLDFDGLPLRVVVPAQARVEVHYNIVPRQRGRVSFGRAELRVRTLHGSFEWVRRGGEGAALPVLPNFAAPSRHPR